MNNCLVKVEFGGCQDNWIIERNISPLTQAETCSRGRRFDRDYASHPGMRIAVIGIDSWSLECVSKGGAGLDYSRVEFRYIAVSCVPV